MLFLDGSSWKNFKLLLNFKQNASVPFEEIPTIPVRTKVAQPTPTNDVAISQLDPHVAPFPPITHQLTLEPLVKITRQLTDALANETTSSTQRLPILIKGETKKAALVPATLLPAEQDKRRQTIRLLGIGSFLLIMLLTILTATPLGQDVGFGFQPGQFSVSLFRNLHFGSNSLAVQATATATYYQHNDGYDPFFNGSQAITNGQFSMDWPMGQCTYWANLRYHELTGFWIPWGGNADQWAANASMAPGWHVSREPHVPSIMVLMPGVQGAGGYGHVAVVEGVNPDGSVHTSNMNWYGNGGGWGRVSNVDFTPGPGVYFVWHS